MTTQQKYILVISRVLFGFLFLASGVGKLTSDFTATQYLDHAVGPFASFFQPMAGNLFVDMLVIWGEILIGIALISGAFMWVTAWSGSLMMLLFYFSQFPPKNGYISYHIIYILVFFLLAVFRAGEFAGFGFVRKRFEQ